MAWATWVGRSVEGERRVADQRWTRAERWAREVVRASASNADVGGGGIGLAARSMTPHIQHGDRGRGWARGKERAPWYGEESIAGSWPC